MRGGRSLLDARDGPLRVLADKRLVVPGRHPQIGKVTGCPFVAQRNADIAEEPATFRPQDG